MKMKRIIHIILASILLLFSFAILASAEQVSSTTAGFSNVPFSNGYYGFCIDEKLKGAETGDSFTSAVSTSVANNNIDGSDVSQKLKILFTECFEDIFIPDGNGGYIIDSYKAGSSVQSAIWNITDGHYIWGESKSFVDEVNAYDGPDIPDEGYSKVLANGDVINFFFAVVEPQKTGQQSFFAYKITVGQNSTHKHEFSDKWESDDNNHWHECECDEKADVENHDGTTADCVNPSVCEICGKTLGDTDSENHTGETEIRNAKPATEFEDGYTGDTHCKDCGKLLKKGETIPATHKHEFSDKWESDDNNHWHECECDEKADVEKHDGTTADCKNPSICEACGKTLGDVNADNHTGETEIRNVKPATEFEDGYTGDTHCKDCGKLLKKGETIPATHKHEFSDKWESDDNNHWHECECGEKSDIYEHVISNGNCFSCGKTFEKTDDIPDENNNTVSGSVSDDQNLSVDFDIILDEIGNLLPDLGSFGNNLNDSESEYSESEPTTGENYESEIPDTGSDFSVFYAWFVFLSNVLALSFIIVKKKIIS